MLMTLLVKFGLSILGLGAPLAAGAYYLTEHLNRPKTFGDRLLRDGKIPIANNEDAKWRAKFSDFGSDMVGKVDGVTNAEDTNPMNQINKLKEWCVSESKKDSSREGYEQYANFCSGDLKYLRGNMISQGLELASSEDDWKLLFLHHKHEADFLKRVNDAQTVNPSLTSSSKASDAQDKVSQYCATLLNVAPSGDNRELATKWCVKSGVDKVEAKLLSLSGFTKPVEGDYEKIVEKWKDNQTFKDTALKNQDSGTDQDKDKLKKYCEAELDKKLISLDGSYDTTMKNIYNFCNGTLPQGSELQNIPWQV